MSFASISPLSVPRADHFPSALSDRPGPRVAPSEAELLIDPHFYSFLSGVAIVLVLLSFSFCIAYMLLSTIRRRQYRKYRQRRRMEEERDILVYSTAQTAPHLRQPPLPPSPLPPPPVFIPRLHGPSVGPLSSAYTLHNRGSLPSFLAPFSAVLSRDGSLPVGAAGISTALPRARLSFASPSSFASSVSHHSRTLWSMLTPRRRRTATDLSASSSSLASPSVSPSPFRPSPNGRSPVPSSVSSPALSSRASLSTTAPSNMEARRRRDSLQPTMVNRQARSDPPSVRSSLSAASTSVRLLSSSHQEELDAQQYEHNRGFLSFSLSTFLLTIALLWLSLIPLTLALHSSLTNHYLLSWLTPHLVSSLWTLITFLSTVSLFIVSPFAYLYYEAEGLFFLPLPTFLPSLSATRSFDDDDAYTFLPRFMETALILFCFSVMLYGSFHLVHCLMYGLPIVSFTWSKLLSLSLLQLLTPSALFSNVLHFLPGLFICLSQSHAGFSALLSSSFSLRVPFYYNHYLRQQLDFIGIKLDHARLLLPGTSSLSRRLVLANRIQSLEQHSTDINKKLHPPFLSLSYFPVLRNAVWFVTTFVCLLLIWHIVVRVMQREARLMVGSLEAMMSESDGEQRGVVMTAVGVVVAVLKWLLRGMKNGVNALLSMVGMIRPADAHKQLTVDEGQDDSSSSSILSVGFLLQLWSDALRLLSSFLLGHNGFKHPVTHLLFDLLIVNFFCWSCAIGLYRMPWMAQYSPFSSFAAKASAAFELDDGRVKGTEVAVGRAQHNGEESRALSHMSSASSSHSATAALSSFPALSAAGIVPSSSAPLSALSSPSALYSAQFFVVNTTVILLLVSSFPFAVWLLGLASSFPLTDFYPAASELTAGLFVHCYNLAFIALSAGQGFSLWSRLLWYLLNTSYRSTYALLTWMLPSLRTRLPSPEVVSALPATVRAHPYAVNVSFLLSAAGLVWAVKASVLPLLYLLWLLLLYLLRILAVGLKLCARGLYVKAVRFINEEMEDPALPSLGRQHSRQQAQQQMEPAASNQLTSPGETRRMRSMDEDRTFTPAAAAALLKEHELQNGRHDAKADEGKEEVKSLPPHHFAPVVRSASAHRSPKQSSRLLAPRPLSLATSISLDALNSLNPALTPALTPPSHSPSTRTAWDNTPSYPPRAVRRSDSAETHSRRGTVSSTTPTRPSNRMASDGTLPPAARFEDMQLQSDGEAAAERKAEQVEVPSGSAV